MMRYHTFRIDTYFPPEFSTIYYEMIGNEKKKKGVEIRHYVEETAPPPEPKKSSYTGYEGGGRSQHPRPILHDIWAMKAGDHTRPSLSLLPNLDYPSMHQKWTMDPPLMNP